MICGFPWYSDKYPVTSTFLFLYFVTSPNLSKFDANIVTEPVFFGYLLSKFRYATFSLTATSAMYAFRITLFPMLDFSSAVVILFASVVTGGFF
jgi:hypothetical protein